MVVLGRTPSHGAARVILGVGSAQDVAQVLLGVGEHLSDRDVSPQLLAQIGRAHV